MAKVYVLAQNLKEATGLRDAGCGYESRADAMKARSSPEIDSYYRNLMKVFEMDELGDKDGAQKGEKL